MYNPAADLKCDVRALPYEDNSVDEIFASHLIEHFDFKEAFDVIREWKRVLKEGGVLVLETPDLLSLCKHFVAADEKGRVDLYGQFFAKAWLPGETHKFLYTENQMMWTLAQIGFKSVIREVNRKWSNWDADINLKVRAIK